jgi:4-diphosphocytidyl-2-C-methyl-D-erythritol kinase
MRIALPARAKLNLDLAVIGRRDDGFHDLRTRMQSIDLHDLLEAERAEETSITVSGFEFSAAVGNSVIAAHAALEAAVDRKLPTRWRLHKRIPPGSGLGGASSDAAAALRALASLYQIKADMAVQLGADVPFFIHGGAALAEGRGERLTPIGCDGGWFAIAWPGIELSTAAVYNAWDEVGGEPPNVLYRAAAHADARVGEFARELGKGWQMTGSGSAFFLRCADRDQAIAAVGRLGCWTAVTNAMGAWS